MYPNVEAYLSELRERLAGSDPATIQDAVADAEDHLQSALEQAQHENPSATPAALLSSIVANFGTPEEIAKAYRDIEVRLTPPFAPVKAKDTRPFYVRFFGVLGEPRAYAALLYLLTSMVTGILYFTWAVTGASLSVGLMVLIFGLPFFGLFVFSIQGLALVEGRLVEALLGVRMPRRQVPFRSSKGIWNRFVARLKDRRTWTTLAYLVLQLPLGILHFTIFIVLLVYSLQLLALPVLQLVFDQPLISLSFGKFFVPLWSMPLLFLAGALDIVVLLHLAKFVGQKHGAMAKALLVQRA
jgi:putative sensor protein/HAAS domain-containing protein